MIRPRYILLSTLHNPHKKNRVVAVGVRVETVSAEAPSFSATIHSCDFGTLDRMRIQTANSSAEILKGWLKDAKVKAFGSRPTWVWGRVQLGERNG